MPHAPGHIREPFIEAFEDYQMDWHKAFRGAREAFRVLGKLWNCTDIVPWHVRSEAVDWLEYYRLVTPGEAGELRGGCTYAQLVRRLLPVLRCVLGEEARKV